MGQKKANQSKVKPTPKRALKTKRTTSKTKKQVKSKIKAKKSLDNAPRDIELELFGDGYKCVVGADEAGRGPLAGPVVAAACFVPAHFEGFDKTDKGEDVIICDSKLMSEKQREIA